MKSVGEVMSIGRNFNETIQKAYCSLETGLSGFDSITTDLELIKKEIRRPNDKRLQYLMDGMRQGLTNEDIFELSKIDPWFLAKFREMYEMELSMTPAILKDEALLRKVKSNGFSDKFIANVIGKTEEDVYIARKALDIDSPKTHQ